LRRLGKPLHLSSQNHLIIKTNFSPPIGALVVNGDRNSIGKIIDVFGPVSSPFVSVKSIGKVNLSEYVKADLFVKSSTPRNNKRKVRRKKFGRKL